MSRSVRRAPASPYHAVVADANTLSGMLRTFKRATDGWTGRLRLPSLGPMRAGRIRCAHVALAELLTVARRAGCSRQWAEEYVVVPVLGLVDALWGDAIPPCRHALERETAAEGATNASMIAAMCDGTPESKQAALDLLEREQAATRVLIASFRRDLAQ